MPGAPEPRTHRRERRDLWRAGRRVDRDDYSCLPSRPPASVVGGFFIRGLMLAESEDDRWIYRRVRSPTQATYPSGRIKYVGVWELPVLGAVTAPAAVLGDTCHRLP
jgi:hypothetical protein